MYLLREPCSRVISSYHGHLVYALTVTVHRYERQKRFSTLFVEVDVARFMRWVIVKLQPAESGQVLVWGVAVCCAGAQWQHHTAAISLSGL